MTNWVKAKFESQSKSFNAIANKIVTSISQAEIKKALIDQMMEDFKKKYDNKNLQDLKMNEWKSLQGTESWNGDTMIKIKKHLKNSNDINILNETICEMLEGKSVVAPIIMMQNKIGMLIAGEHTLMACRLLNIQPRVVMF
jgi:ethanolamine utilization protein EutQ (cupin superfamily)